MEYLKQVQEELLSSMKSSNRPTHGTQELNDVVYTDKLQFININC